ncbi:MAG: T9SS type A sorting domain-containing protein, partial [Candidatus Marinimicrobia bacterium]|nr:T9SS type A sorting domain-containing protein [Candidatus Neomarinimicrobiota bacterium]
IENLGFNIYLSTKYNDQFSIINDQLIPGAGNSSQRHDYEYVDKGLTNGVTYWYKLEDVDYSGKTELHGPVSATPIESAFPAEFRLYQNYPNPFNPVTTISYDLPEDGFVELSVYNMRGEKVTTLLKSNQEAGSYKVNWDGRNENGEIVSSGIYFLRIVSGSYSKTNKMIFIR